MKLRIFNLSRLVLMCVALVPSAPVSPNSAGLAAEQKWIHIS